MIRLISLTQVSRWNPAELCRVKMKHCNTDQIANSRIYGRRGPSAILHRILSPRHQWIYIYWKYAAFRCTVRSWSLCLKKFSVRNSAQFCGYRFLKNIWHGRRSRSFLGRLPKVDLKILEGGMSVRTSVHTSVRPSTKSFFDLNEIWYIGRGRWMMHDGMPYGRIQGQGQGHEPLKVWIPSIFKTYLLRHLQWELASDH